MLFPNPALLRVLDQKNEIPLIHKRATRSSVVHIIGIVNPLTPLSSKNRPTEALTSLARLKPTTMVIFFLLSHLMFSNLHSLTI